MGKIFFRNGNGTLVYDFRCIYIPDVRADNRLVCDLDNTAMRNVLTLRAKRGPMEEALLEALADARKGSVALLTVIYTRKDGEIVQYHIAEDDSASGVLAARLSG